MIGSISLKKGSHTIAIENIDGQNAVNLIAVIPKKKTEEYYNSAYEFLSNKELIYTFEAESKFDHENAEILDIYGSRSSMGNVLQLKDDGFATLPVQIIRAGNYSLAIRTVTGGW